MKKVTITNAGANKLAAVKIVKDLLTIRLKEAKDIVDESLEFELEDSLVDAFIDELEAASKGSVVEVK